MISSTDGQLDRRLIYSTLITCI